MHQNRFRLGLRPRPRSGADSAPPDPLAGLKGLLLREGDMGREGKGRKGRRQGRGGEGGEGTGRGRDGKGGHPPSSSFLVICLVMMMKDERLVSKMEGKTNFSRHLQAVWNRDC